MNASEIMMFSGADVSNVTVLNWAWRFRSHIRRIQKKYKIEFIKTVHVDKKLIGWKRKPSKKYKRGPKKLAYKIILIR